METRTSGTLSPVKKSHVACGIIGNNYSRRAGGAARVVSHQSYSKLHEWCLCMQLRTITVELHQWKPDMFLEGHRPAYPPKSPTWFSGNERWGKADDVAGLVRGIL